MGVARILVWGKHFWGSAPRRIFEIFLKKIAKMHYFRIFFKRFNKHALTFRAFGRKTQIVGKCQNVFDENSIEKWNFLLFLENLLLKIEPSQKNTIFQQQFFRFRGDFSPFPPWLRHWVSGMATSPEIMENIQKMQELGFRKGMLFSLK